MEVLLEGLGLALGGLVYVGIAVWAVGAVRSAARGAVALYWLQRSRAEDAAVGARVYGIQHELPAARRERRAA